ncbi:MAG TPA: hypothetical protein VIY48_15205 [Candidatus Paceibacterota bacterium]
MTATLSDQHDQWHRMYGMYAVCNLDCGSAETAMAVFENDYQALLESGKRGIKCGSCKGRHLASATVKFCYEVKRDSERYEKSMAAFDEMLESAGECEHGLSAALCEGPNHYPQDL